MDALIVAGGVISEQSSLKEIAAIGEPKALIPLAGKPMLQWVLDALSLSKSIERIIIVGLDESSALFCPNKQLIYLPNQGNLVDNSILGARKALEVNSSATQLLWVSCDIPLITTPMVDWLIQQVMQEKKDALYQVISKTLMQKSFPAQTRTFLRLKNKQICFAQLF